MATDFRCIFSILVLGISLISVRIVEGIVAEDSVDDDYQSWDEAAEYRPILERVPENEFLLGRANETATSFSCDFNRTLLNGSIICDLWNLDIGESLFSRSNWILGSGNQAYFLGGPTIDGSGQEPGNYAVFDVSVSRFSPPESKNGWLVTVPYPASDPSGICFTFQYNLYGLGIDSLQVLLLYNVEYETVNVSGIEERKVVSYETSLLWEKNDTTDGNWKLGLVSFTSQTEFQLVFNAIPSVILDKYEGYAAIDVTVFTYGACPGDCSFEADFCSWQNVNDSTVQFQWSLGRGTLNTITGPLRDHPSTVSMRPPGGYAYIDSSYPRRHGDTARLLGPTFPQSLVAKTPYCFTFWMSAYGPKIGGLSIMLIPVGGGTPITIWKLRPEKLTGLPDLWFLSQVVLVSATDFQVRIDASIGETGESDIAIDDISFQPGPCPAMPSMAAPPGDCTFDDDYCGYTVKSSRQAPYSPPLWNLVRGQPFPGFPLGHTRVPKYKLDSFVRFDTNNFQHAPLDRSFLLSPSLSTDNTAAKYCLTFWFNMFALAPTKDGLGALQVAIVRPNSTSEPNPKKVIDWRLNNHQNPKWEFAQLPFMLNNGTQIAFEGIEGLRTLGNIAVDDISLFPIYQDDSICQILPERAQMHDGNCYFDSDDMCGWKASSSITGSTTWVLANTWDAPNNINDHTFGAPRCGFTYFNPAGQPNSQQAVFESPEIKLGNDTIGACFSFWFLVAGDDPDSTLVIADRPSINVGTSELMRIKAADYVRNLNNPQWNFGQVTVGLNVTSFQVFIYATGSYGIVALDDITIVPVPTECAKRQ